MADTINLIDLRERIALATMPATPTHSAQRTADLAIGNGLADRTVHDAGFTVGDLATAIADALAAARTNKPAFSPAERDLIFKALALASRV
jgi:hypothetical protein